MNIKNKTIVITGATGGIGQAIAHLLAKQGASLLLIARDQAKLKNLTLTLGSGHHWLSADICTKEGRTNVIKQSCELNAQILINNAGISQFDSLMNIDEEAFNDAIMVNLMAPIYLTRSFLKMCKSKNAKTVVNVGSALGSIGYPFYTSYCASKFGLRGFTEALQRELSHSNDNILYFAPRATATSINSDAVIAMNKTLGNSVDEPELVAFALLKQLQLTSQRKVLGWPEKFFTRLNGLLPELVDKAIAKQLKTVKQFVQLSSHS